MQFGFKEAKAAFFDSKKVTSSVDKATRQRLSRFGAFVRTSARDLIRKKKGSSQAGDPPHSHIGLLRKFLFFAFDSGQRSVVIGPVRLNERGGKAPELLELGGTETLHRSSGKAFLATYEPRPFMKPAFDKNLPSASALWANSVK